jgi:hypothetical protein
MERIIESAVLAIMRANSPDQLLGAAKAVLPGGVVFDNREAAAEWRGSSAHQSLLPILKALYSDSKLQVYDVIA